MKADPRFLRQLPTFWAYVRALSEALKYTDRETKQIKVHTLEAIVAGLLELGLSAVEIQNTEGQFTPLGYLLRDYFIHRADVLNRIVEPNLMTGEKAARLFHQIRRRHRSQFVVPMNKQTAAKKAPAYFTGIIHMLIEAHRGARGCIFDPQRLTSFTRDKRPLRTLARRVDGAFPRTIDPVAVWEIKEYYYTTTFGSRVADGVYETLLDGLELKELRENEGVHVGHYLFVDAYDTWWLKGRSYLCRMIDMLHMGLVTEVIFGAEAENRVPELVDEWKIELARRHRD